MYFAPMLIMEIIAAGMATWSYEKTCELIELYRVEMRAGSHVMLPYLIRLAS